MTDGRTHDDSIYPASTARVVKNPLNIKTENHVRVREVSPTAAFNDGDETHYEAQCVRWSFDE